MSHPQDDSPKGMKVLRALNWVLLAAGCALSAVYLKGAFDPPPNRQSADFITNGMPVFFITLVALFLAVRKKPGGD